MVVELRIGEGKEFWSFLKLRTFKKRASQLVTYKSGPSKTQLDYSLTGRNQRKLLKDIKVLPREECITQHKPLVCNKKSKTHHEKAFIQKKDMETTWRNCTECFQLIRQQAKRE